MIVIGRFGRVHGLKGFITVHSYTEPRDNILQYTQWYALIDKQWQALNSSCVEVTGKHILVKVDGFNERELVNIEIWIKKEQLPKLADGEFYWHQLIGMQVQNPQGEILGCVVEILPTGSNDVLVVKGVKRHLIPYLPGRSIININSLQRLIVVEWEVDL